MASCPDLPPELLPEILRHLPKVHHLTRTALVDHLFYQATIPELYKRASIYSWHKEGKLKVAQGSSVLIYSLKELGFVIVPDARLLSASCAIHPSTRYAHTYPSCANKHTYILLGSFA